MRLEVRTATDADARRLHRLRRDAEDWLAERGVEQWGHGWLRPADVRRQVDRGEWHVAVPVGASRPVAGLRLLWSDAPVWQTQDAFAAYVHGLVVDRRFAGRGIGAALLRWAEQQGRTAGAPALRLDCVESNARLRAYYAALGFREVGRRDFDGPWFPAVLLEKPIAPEAG